MGKLSKALSECRKLAPFDKLKPGNIQQALDYAAYIKTVHPESLNFADDKLLEDSELFNWKTQTDPVTGEQ